MSNLHGVAEILYLREKKKNTNNKITLLLHNNKIILLSTNCKSVNSKYYERRWFVLGV